jgi:hypothetical protein
MAVGSKIVIDVEERTRRENTKEKRRCEFLFET